MGIDISKLEGALKAIACMADSDKNGKIEGKTENSIFESNAAIALNAKLITEDEYKNIFGLETKEPASATTATTPTAPATTNPMSKKEKKAAEKAAEGREDFVVRALNTVVNAGSSDVVKDLHTALENVADTPEYVDLQGQVQYILNKVNEILEESKKQGKDPKDTINDLEKKVKDALYISKKDKFAKEVLNLLVKNAKQTQMSNEYKEVQDAFKQEVAKGDKTYNEALKAVKEKYKDKGSYYKKALNNLEDKYVKPLKDEKAYAAIQEAEVEGEATRKKVRTSANKILEKDDIHISKRRFREISTGKETRVHAAVGNRVREINVENAKSQSKEQILKAIGGKEDLFEALIAAGLITKKEDGNYDLTNLSNIIIKEVGSDLYLDKMTKDYNIVSEKHGTYKTLELETKLDDLSDGEAKDLIELCGIEIQGKNWGKVLLKTTIGAVIGAITSGGAEAARPNEKQNYYDEPTIEQYLHVDTNDLDNIKYEVWENGVLKPGADMPAIDINIPEGGTNGSQAIIDIAINLKQVQDIAFNGGKFILSNALRGAIIGAAAGFLDGVLKDDTREIPVAELGFECTTLADYIKTVEKKNPEWADVLTVIAMTFSDEEGNWNCAEYKAFLEKAAGNDILNRKELVAELQKLRKELEAKPEPEPPVVTEPEPVSTQPEQEEAPCEGKNCDPLTRENINMKDSNKFFWDEIINMYYSDCLKNHTEKEIRFQLRKVNNTKNTYDSVPANLLLPYDLFGDGSCERTERKPFKPSPLRGKSTTIKVDPIKTPQGGWQAGMTCKNADGSFDIVWFPETYKTKEEAERAAQEATGE